MKNKKTYFYKAVLFIFLIIFSVPMVVIAADDPRAVDLVNRAARECARLEPQVERWESDFSDPEKFIHMPAALKTAMKNHATLLRNNALGSDVSLKAWCVAMEGADKNNFAATSQIFTQLDENIKISIVLTLFNKMRSVDNTYKVLKNITDHKTVLSTDINQFAGFTAAAHSRVPDLDKTNTMITEKKTELDNKINEANNGLPAVTDYTGILTQAAGTALGNMEVINTKLSQANNALLQAVRAHSSAQTAMNEKMKLAADENFITIDPENPGAAPVRDGSYYRRIYFSRRSNVEGIKHRTAVSIDQSIAALTRYANQMNGSLTLRNTTETLLKNYLGDLKTNFEQIKIDLEAEIAYYAGVKPLVDEEMNTMTRSVFLPLATEALSLHGKIKMKNEMKISFDGMNDPAKHAILRGAPPGGAGIDLANFNGVNFLADELGGIDLGQFDALQTKAEDAIGNVLNALPVDQKAKFQEFSAAARAYQVAFSQQQGKVNRAKGIWLRIIGQAANNIVLDPATFGTDLREQKIFADFNARRTSFKEQVRAIAARRVDTLQQLQAQVQALNDVQAPIDFSASTNNVILVLNKFNADAQGIDNYSALRDHVRNLKNSGINSVYIPLLNLYRSIDRAYQKVDFLTVIASHLKQRADVLGGDLAAEAATLVADINTLKTTLGDHITDVGNIKDELGTMWMKPLADMDPNTAQNNYRTVSDEFRTTSKELSSLIGKSNSLFRKIQKAEQEAGN